MLNTAPTPRQFATPGRQVPAGARALYLGSEGKKQVTNTHDALVVTNAYHYVYRYPMARLARIVSSTLVDWSGTAVVLCMRCGVSIAWLDARGQVMGVAHPQPRSRISCATALELMVEGPNGLLDYQHWQRARRMQVYVQWAQAQDADLPARHFEATKRDWVYASLHPNHLQPALRALCTAYVAAQLVRHGLPPVLWATDVQRIDLNDDLCELLWAEMNLCAGNLTDSTAHTTSITALFESWSAHNASALLLHIHSLQRSAMKALAA